MFNEKKEEYSVKQGKNIPVWQTDKYLESRDKAVEIIKSEKYALKEGDFWINMNETKSGKMAYTGLIISHNGCLKINDALPAEQKFRPGCVSLDKEGYGNSLVYSYCCDEQGIYEVGEVNPKNCRIDYPYAMAFKRMMDRVILKSSKLAYAGIYSEVEADEFKQRLEDKTEPAVTPPPGAPEYKPEAPKEVPKEEPPKVEKPIQFRCLRCDKVLKPIKRQDGSQVSVRQWDEFTNRHYGQSLCWGCVSTLYPDFLNFAAELK